MERVAKIGLAVMIAFLFVGTLPFPQSSDNEHKASIDTTGYVGQGWSMPASGYSVMRDWPANWRTLNASDICDIDYNPGAYIIAFHYGGSKSYVRGDRAAHGVDWDRELNSSCTDVQVYSDMGHAWTMDYTMYEQFPVFLRDTTTTQRFFPDEAGMAAFSSTGINSWPAAFDSAVLAGAPRMDFYREHDNDSGDYTYYEEPFYSFDTSSLPNNAHIESVTFQSRLDGWDGMHEFTPFEVGLYSQHFGTYSSYDYDASASYQGVFLSDDMLKDAGDPTILFQAFLTSADPSMVSKTGLSQYTLKYNFTSDPVPIGGYFEQTSMQMADDYYPFFGAWLDVQYTVPTWKENAYDYSSTFYEQSGQYGGCAFKQVTSGVTSWYWDYTFSDEQAVYVGSRNSTGTYTVIRYYFSFDTLVIPDDAVVNNATVSFWVGDVWHTNMEFNLSLYYQDLGIIDGQEWNESRTLVGQFFNSASDTNITPVPDQSKNGWYNLTVPMEAIKTMGVSPSGFVVISNNETDETNNHEGASQLHGDYTDWQHTTLTVNYSIPDRLPEKVPDYSQYFTANKTVTGYRIDGTNASWIDIRSHNSTTVELYGTPPLRDKTYIWWVNFSVDGSGTTWFNYTIEADPNPPNLLVDETYTATFNYVTRSNPSDVLNSTWLRATGTSWPPTNVANGGNSKMYVGGQRLWSGTQILDRIYLTFNTSTLPDDANIEAVQLRFMTQMIDVASNGHFIEIDSSDFGSIPDWNASLTQVGLGSTADKKGDGSNDGVSFSFSLTPSSINKTGLTNYVLRLPNDNSSSGLAMNTSAFSTMLIGSWGGDSEIPYIFVRYSIGYHDNGRNWTLPDYARSSSKGEVSLMDVFGPRSGWIENYKGVPDQYGLDQYGLLGAYNYAESDKYRTYMTFETSMIPKYSEVKSVTFGTQLFYVDADSNFNVDLYRQDFGLLGLEDWNGSKTFVKTLFNTTGYSNGDWVNISLPVSSIKTGEDTQFVLMTDAENWSGAHSIQLTGTDLMPGWGYRYLSVEYEAPDEVYEHSNYFYYPEANQTIDTWDRTTNATTLSVTAHNDTAGVVHWHPNNLNAGRYYSVNVSFTNANGTGYEEFRVSVLNIQPVFMSSPTTEGRTGNVYTYNSNVDEKSEGGLYTGIKTNYGGTYSWDNGNGNLQIASPTPGTYWFNISFDDQSHTDNATVYQNFIVVFRSGAAVALEAEFSFKINGVNVTFYDESRGAIQTWYWQFGDGTTSMQRNPKHVYAQAGTYEVTLIIMDGFGNSLQVKHSLIVEKKVTAFTVPQSFLVPLVAIILIGAGMIAIKNKFAALIGIALIVVVLILWLMGLMPVTNVGW